MRPQPVPLDVDALHEMKIKAALADFNREPSYLGWRVVKRLVGERSPEQVARMERRMGLMKIIPGARDS